MAIVEYQWDWGDGSAIQITTSATTQHTYDLSGEYNITLTVIDDAGLSDSITKTVTVSPRDIGTLGTGILGTASLGETPVATVSGAEPIITAYSLNQSGSVVPTETETATITPIGGFAFFEAQTSTVSTGLSGRTGITSVDVVDSPNSLDLSGTGINDADGSARGGINESEVDLTGISAAVLSSDGIHDLRFD